MLDWLVRDGKDLVLIQNSGYSEKNLSYPPGNKKNQQSEEKTCRRRKFQKTRVLFCICSLKNTRFTLWIQDAPKISSINVVSDPYVD